jgi:hypothetical protein
MKFLRLDDNETLQNYDVFQEFPHTYEWRQTQMSQINLALNNQA